VRAHASGRSDDHAAGLSLCSSVTVDFVSGRAELTCADRRDAPSAEVCARLPIAVNIFSIIASNRHVPAVEPPILRRAIECSSRAEPCGRSAAETLFE